MMPLDDSIDKAIKAACRCEEARELLSKLDNEGSIELLQLLSIQ